MKELVVARYHENLNWIKPYMAQKVTIYNKGDSFIEGAIPLPNVGREAHTYLYHIVNKWNDLYPYTAFVQGNPFPHCYTIEDELRYNTRLKFLCNHSPCACDWQGNPNHPGLDVGKFIEEMWVDFPIKELIFFPGAMFQVSKEVIKQHTLDWWKKLLLLTSDEKTSGVFNINTGRSYCRADPMAGYAFERLWPYIFSDQFKERI